MQWYWRRLLTCCTWIVSLALLAAIFFMHRAVTRIVPALQDLPANLKAGYQSVLDLERLSSNFVAIEHAARLALASDSGEGSELCPSLGQTFTNVSHVLSFANVSEALNVEGRAALEQVAMLSRARHRPPPREGKVEASQVDGDLLTGGKTPELLTSSPSPEGSIEARSGGRALQVDPDLMQFLQAQLDSTSASMIRNGTSQEYTNLDFQLDFKNISNGSKLASKINALKLSNVSLEEMRDGLAPTLLSDDLELWYDANISVSSLTRKCSTVAEKSTIVKLMNDSLSRIVKVLRDPYFGTEKFDGMLNEWTKQLDLFASMPAINQTCIVSSIAYCAILHGATDAFYAIQGAAQLQTDHFEAEGLAAMETYGNFAVALYALPIVMLTALACLGCYVLKRRYFGCAALDALTFLPHTVVLVLALGLCSAICAAGLAFQFYPQVLKIDSLPGRPTILDVVHHLQAAYPDLWTDVFANLFDGLELLVRACLAFEIILAHVLLLACACCSCCCVRSVSQRSQRRDRVLDHLQLEKLCNEVREVHRRMADANVDHNEASERVGEADSLSCAGALMAPRAQEICEVSFGVQSEATTLPQSSEASSEARAEEGNLSLAI